MLHLHKAKNSATSLHTKNSSLSMEKPAKPAKPVDLSVKVPSEGLPGFPYCLSSRFSRCRSLHSDKPRRGSCAAFQVQQMLQEANGGAAPPPTLRLFSAGQARVEAYESPLKQNMGSRLGPAPRYCCELSAS